MIRELINRIRKATCKRGFVCDCCRAELFTYPVPRICKECENELFETPKYHCDVCGRATLTGGICLICKETPPSFIGLSPFVYIGNTASVVVRIKNGNRRLSYFFGERMAELFDKRVRCVGKVMVVPVPMTKKRMKKRGYNQALDLAERVYEELLQRGYDVELCDDALIKRRETPPQKQLSMRARRANMKGVYHLQRRSIFKDKTVIIVDDIMTTGATGDVCAKLCKRAGAGRVYFLTSATAPEQVIRKG